MIDSRAIVEISLNEDTGRLVYDGLLGHDACVVGDFARAAYLHEKGYIVPSESCTLLIKSGSREAVRNVLFSLDKARYSLTSTHAIIPGAEILYLQASNRPIPLRVIVPKNERPQYIGDILRSLPLNERFALSKERLGFRIWWDVEAGQVAEQEAELAKINSLTGSENYGKIESQSSCEGDVDNC